MTARRRVLWASALLPWLVAALVWSLVQTVQPSAPPDHRRSGSALADGAGPATPVREAADGSDPDAGRRPGRPAGSDWSAILDRLDRSRTRAYAEADPARLRAVYVAGSPVQRHDVAILRAYAEQDVRLTGVRLRVLAVRLVGRAGPYVRLHVIDRLARPTAHTSAGPIRLPRDRATAHIVVLRATAGGWRIAAVRTVAI